MRRIHWPTTARRGQLIVKEFEQDPQAEVWIFLDAQQRVAGSEKLRDAGHAPRESAFHPQAQAEPSPVDT